MATLKFKKVWKRIRKRTKKARDFIALIAVLFFQRVFLLLPPAWGIRVGGFLGRFAYFAVFWERKNAIKNLRQAFSGEKDDTEIRKIARRVFINTGYSFAEILYLSFLGDDYLKSHVSLKGTNYFNYYNKQGKGIIAITGHFGSWELMAAYFSRIEKNRLCVVARRLSNRYLERLLMENRRRIGMNVVHRGNTAVSFLRALRSGETVGILADQDTRGDGIFVDFFGKPAWTQIGPAWLALRLDAPVVPLFIVRSNNNPTHHTIYMDSPLSFELTGDTETDIRSITELLTKTIESYIRRFPDQWMWFHRRWKTQPSSPGDESEAHE